MSKPSQPTQSDALRELLDERAIRQVVLRYCRGIDRMDRELVRACYHPGAEDHHGSFRGDVDAFIEWVWRLLEHYDSTMHLVGNLLVEFASPQVACVETYGTAFHRGDPEEAKRNLVTGFRYIDRFERRDGDWRIAKRVATTEWARVDVPENWWPISDDLLSGTRDRSDPVYACLSGAPSVPER
ncbi:MAG: nuclear transport factor 2 family protein [Myxococcota bacterium]|nr:nuclear transport factor 2 family protein [Myxococcota bacterium]